MADARLSYISTCITACSSPCVPCLYFPQNKDKSCVPGSESYPFLNHAILVVVVPVQISHKYGHDVFFNSLNLAPPESLRRYYSIKSLGARYCMHTKVTPT